MPRAVALDQGWTPPGRPEMTRVRALDRFFGVDYSGAHTEIQPQGLEVQHGLAIVLTTATRFIP